MAGPQAIPTDPPRLLNRGPALVLGIQYGDDPEVVAAHRIYLDQDGAKLRLADPDEPGETLDPKKAVGRFRGCHIRLGDWSGQPTEAVVAEGPENCLSLSQGLGLPGLCTISGGNLHVVRLPSFIRSIVLGADPDEPGQEAAEKARISYAEQGAETRVITPPEGAGDWNDVAMREEGLVI